MHIFFSYIGGGGIAPLALIAKQAGFKVSGSEKMDSSPYLKILKNQGIDDIGIGVDDAFISKMHSQEKIDWYVYSSAVEKEYPNHPEFEFCRKNGIKMSKRDELLNQIIETKDLKLLAVAGTHGKTTTTAMAIWVFKSLGIPVSYSVGTKLSFGEMGEYEPASQYFVYECDEFDRNFLAFKPYISMITGVSWDHHEVYPTNDDYNQAFRQFINQSDYKVLWNDDQQRLKLDKSNNQMVLDENEPEIQNIKLAGLYNRRDAYLVAKSLFEILDVDFNKLLNVLSDFPGLSRRFEKIKDNLYTDYAHTPEKITGAISTASESLLPGQKLVIVYEPLTNRRMHYTKHLHKDLFDLADQLYWVPSYLAREDPNQEVLKPEELIKSLNPSMHSKAQPAELNETLKNKIDQHLNSNDLVLCLSGGGGNSLDDWLRKIYLS